MGVVPFGVTFAVTVPVAVPVTFAVGGTVEVPAGAVVAGVVWLVGGAVVHPAATSIAVARRASITRGRVPVRMNVQEEMLY
jgi:hypothetical protein